MKKLIFNLVWCLMILSVVIYAQKPYDFSTAVIKNEGENRYKAVRLTPEIYNNASYDLADILIYNETFETIPYFVNSFTESKSSFEETYDMHLINNFVKDEYFYYDYEIVGNYDRDIMATSIEMESTDRNFAKRIELLGSHDNINWESVKIDNLYNVEGNVKLDIFFGKPQKYTYYRFKISNNLEKISFDSVKLVYSETVREHDFFIDTMSLEFEVEQEDKTTVITVKGIKNMRISEMHIETGDVFKRTFRYANGRSKTLYRLDFDGTEYRDTVLDFKGFETSDDELLITIDDQDDRPIKIDGIKAIYLVDELIFEGASDETYVLSFGNKEIETPFVYDIANYKDLILKNGYDLLKIDEINIKKSEEPIEEISDNDYRLLFNIIVIVISLALGGTIILRLKKDA